VRLLLSLIMLAWLTGCASEYFKVPEPTGAWVPANPPRLTGEVPQIQQPTRLYSTRQGGWR
jgi:hypothetical protein